LSNAATKVVTKKRNLLLASLRRHLEGQLGDKLEAAHRLALLLFRIINVHVRFSKYL
jgi:hypothetical protein